MESKPAHMPVDRECIKYTHAHRSFFSVQQLFFFLFCLGGPFVCVVCPQGYFGLVVALNGIARRERARSREWDRPEQQEAIRRQGEIAFTVSRSIPIWQGGL